MRSNKKLSFSNLFIISIIPQKFLIIWKYSFYNQKKKKRTFLRIHLIIHQVYYAPYPWESSQIRQLKKFLNAYMYCKLCTHY